MNMIFGIALKFFNVSVDLLSAKRRSMHVYIHRYNGTARTCDFR